MVPYVGSAELVVVVYGAILVAALGSFASTGRFVSIFFLMCTVATGVLAYAEQALAIRALQSSASTYILRCDLPGQQCGVVAQKSVLGTSPADQDTWELPSAVAQVVVMAATFWTVYAVNQNNQRDKNDRSSLLTVAIRTLILWLLALTPMLYGIQSGYVTATQVIAGTTVGFLCGIASIMVVPTT